MTGLEEGEGGGCYGGGVVSCEDCDCDAFRFWYFCFLTFSVSDKFERQPLQ